MASPLLIPVLLIIVGLPVAWLISEFKARAGVRFLLGVLAILSSFSVAFLAGQVNRFNYNAWYGHATKSLIDTSVEEFEQGRGDSVVAEWKDLQGRFHPTYESRADYHQLVEESVQRMKTKDASPDNPRVQSGAAVEGEDDVVGTE
jgi:hypothetical protein